MRNCIFAGLDSPSGINILNGSVSSKNYYYSLSLTASWFSFFIYSTFSSLSRIRVPGSFALKPFDFYISKSYYSKGSHGNYLLTARLRDFSKGYVLLNLALGQFSTRFNSPYLSCSRRSRS